MGEPAVPRRRAELATTSEGYADLANQLEQSRQRLERIDDARAAWYQHTAEVRARADAARDELKHRDVSSAATETGTDHVRDDATAPSRNQTLRQDPQDAADEQAEAQPAPRTEPVTGAQAEHSPTEHDPESDNLRWPTGIPTPDQLAGALQRANEAVQTMRDRERSTTGQHVAEQQRDQPDIDHQHDTRQPDDPTPSA